MKRTRDRAAGPGCKGFTLIELLMVIAVIMVLMTLLTPGLHRVMAKARQTKCMANMKAMGVGMLGYVAEHGTYPGSSETSTSGRLVASWVTRSRKYAGGATDIFVCPSMPPEYRWQQKFGTGSNYSSSSLTSKDVTSLFYEVRGNQGELLFHGGAPFGYGYNDWGTFGAFGIGDRDFGMGGDPGWPRPSPGQVLRPSRQIVVTDRHPTANWAHITDPTNPYEMPAAVHSGGTNVLMADGSVEWMDWNKLVHINKQQADGVAMRRRWNRDYEPHISHGPTYCICEKCAPGGWWHTNNRRYSR